MGYLHLAENERYQIFALLKAGHGVSTIARHLLRHRATIYRELKRNLIFDPRVTGYSPSRAQSCARARVIIRSKRQRISKVIWAIVIERLHQKFSPEQISGHLARAGLYISHERIYQHIWSDKRGGGFLWLHLRGRHRRGRRYQTHRSRSRGQIVGRVGIEHRPKVVEQRKRIGDVEIDLVFGSGRREALLTIVDRHTKYLAVEKVASKHAEVVADALIHALDHLGRPTLTITSDNGKEFSQHARIAEAIGASYYFARPYASWERGTNENTNGLLRQYFPKDRDFSTINQEEIDFAVTQLNNRPRKTLGFKTPIELFFN